MVDAARPDANLRPRLEDAGLDLSHPPFSVIWLAPGHGIGPPQDLSYRPATDEHWASLHYQVPISQRDPELKAVVKQWVNDWWPPTCPDIPLRDKGQILWVPACSELQSPPRPPLWVAGTHHQGTAGLCAHIAGTNVDIVLPERILPTDPLVRQMLSRFHVAEQGPISWYERAYHPHRDIPDRGWGDGLVASVDWAPWFAAPEHPDSPPPDLLDDQRLPPGWHADATGARANPRLDHSERQWVIVDEQTGDPLLWARATPLGTRHRHPLLVQVDGRYRLDWEETPVGWTGSLDPTQGHHVVLLERGGLRIEAWVSLAARMTRREAAQIVDRAFDPA